MAKGRKLQIRFGSRLNRSIYGDIILFSFLALLGSFSAWPMVFVVNNAFKPLNEILLSRRGCLSGTLP